MYILFWTEVVPGEGQSQGRSQRSIPRQGHRSFLGNVNPRGEVRGRSWGKVRVRVQSRWVRGHWSQHVPDPESSDPRNCSNPSLSSFCICLQSIKLFWCHTKLAKCSTTIFVVLWVGREHWFERVWIRKSEQIDFLPTLLETLLFFLLFTDLSRIEGEIVESFASEITNRYSTWHRQIEKGLSLSIYFTYTFLFLWGKHTRFTELTDTKMFTALRDDIKSSGKIAIFN